MNVLPSSSGNMLMTLSDGALQCAETRGDVPWKSNPKTSNSKIRNVEIVFLPPEGTLWLEPEQTLA